MAWTLQPIRRGHDDPMVQNASRPAQDSQLQPEV